MFSRKELSELNRLVDHIRNLAEPNIPENKRQIKTPIELCFDLLSNINITSETKILVLTNIEFIQVLYKLLQTELTNVTFITNNDYKAQAAELTGATSYKYDSYNEFFGDKTLPKFDVVIGNPPYQNDTDSKSEALWKKFIIQTNNILLPFGIMSFVCPPGWKDRLKTNERMDKSALELNSVFNNNDLLYINIHECRKYFKNGSLFSYFILRKSKTENLKTEIISEFNNNVSISTLNIDKMNFIPNDISPIGLSILHKVFNSSLDKLNGQFSEISGYRVGSKNISKIKTNKFKFLISNTSAQYSKNIYLYTNKKQIGVQNKSKIIFSDSGYAKPYFDDGVIGLGHHSRCIFINKNEKSKYLSFLTSNLVKYLLKSSKTASGTAVDFSLIIHLLPKPKTLNFYKDFNLTQEEIEYIENNI